MRIYFVRHGQSLGNIKFVPNKLRPVTDPLTEFGKQQAIEVAQYIKQQPVLPEYIVSSPYTRASETARAIEAALNVPLVEDERLKEYDPGDWDGLPEDEFWQQFEAIAPEKRAAFHPPNGESWVDEALRMKAVIDEVVIEQHQCIVVVSHQSPIKAVINTLTTGTPDREIRLLECPTGSVITLDGDDDTWTISGIWPEA